MALPEQRTLPTTSTHSTTYGGISNSFSNLRPQENALEIRQSAAFLYNSVDNVQLSHMQVPWNMQILVPKTTVQGTISVVPEAAFDFHSSQLAPITVASDTFETLLQSPLSNHFIMQRMQTLSALLTNANILHINCAPPYSLGVQLSSSTRTPAALSPTMLQSEVPHFPYIDLLPFSSMRNMLLRSSKGIDRDEIWSDLTMGGVSIWGNTPWDKRGWEVHVDFARKWWWLMTDEVLDEANFWRAQRGEAILDIKPVKETLNVSAESLTFLKNCFIEQSK